jgi:hypothetical protein
MPIINIYSENRLITPKQYLLSQIISWLWMIVWFGVWILVFKFWNRLTWYYKLSIFIIIAAMTPDSIADLKKLFKPYEQYKREWEKVNKM